MKQLIIIMGTIVLGIFLFQMMTGDNPGSLKNSVREIMINSVEEYAKQGGSSL